MKLLVNCDVPFRGDFLIAFSGKSQMVNEDITHISFDFVECGEYFLEFKHEPTQRAITFINVIIYIITCIIQGIFNIILMNTDSNWHEMIIPYCLNSKIKLELNEDRTIYLKYRYYGGFLPRLFIDNREISEAQYIPNSQDFDSKFLGYCKKLISILMVNLFVLNLILFSCLKTKGYTVLSLSIICLESILILATMFILIREYKRMRKLKEDFIQNMI